MRHKIRVPSLTDITAGIDSTLMSLQGPLGDTGTTGRPGSRGPTGRVGRIGFQGDRGEDGDEVINRLTALSITRDPTNDCVLHCRQS